MNLCPKKSEIDATERALAALHPDDMRVIMEALQLDIEGRLGLARALCVFGRIARQRPHLIEAGTDPAVAPQDAQDCAGSTISPPVGPGAG